MSFSIMSCFSSCQRNVLLGLGRHADVRQTLEVSVVVRRMYYWDYSSLDLLSLAPPVSVVVRRMYYWDLLLNRQKKSLSVSVVVRRMYYWDEEPHQQRKELNIVSVVVRRMYYWDFKRNRLKTKDFDRLNSELFFENARSARKVALFSKNWGYCLTIQNISGNI